MVKNCPIWSPCVEHSCLKKLNFLWFNCFFLNTMWTCTVEYFQHVSRNFDIWWDQNIWCYLRHFKIEFKILDFPFPPKFFVPTAVSEMSRIPNKLKSSRLLIQYEQFCEPIFIIIVMKCVFVWLLIYSLFENTLFGLEHSCFDKLYFIIKLFLFENVGRCTV